ncbi:MAG TPA: molybdopterin synthase sulfur carrier subunit, partial [Noviherbaspirillum sp.]
MQIQLRFFASVREKVGSAQESLDVPESVRTVGDVRALLRERGGAWAETLAE